jgi:hypothetical protein
MDIRKSIIWNFYRPIKGTINEIQILKNMNFGLKKNLDVYLLKKHRQGWYIMTQETLSLSFQMI